MSKKLIHLAIAAILLTFLIGFTIVSAAQGTDSYEINWIVPSNVTVNPSQNITITPAFTLKVPHVELGRHLNFKTSLTLLKQTIIKTWLNIL